MMFKALSSRSVFSVAVIGAAFLFSASHSVQAQNAPAAAPKPKPAAKPAKQAEKSTTSPELRQECVAAEYDLAQRKKTNREEVAKHNESASAFKVETEEIQKNRDTLDRTSQAAIDAYNQRVDVYKATASMLEKNSESLIGAEEKYKADVASFNKRCVGIVVLPNERDAILKAHLAKTAKP